MYIVKWSLTKEQRQNNEIKIVFSINGAGTMDIHIQTSPHKTTITKLDTDLIPFTSINLKWIINLNVKCKTIKWKTVSPWKTMSKEWEDKPLTSGSLFAEDTPDKEIYPKYTKNA